MIGPTGPPDPDLLQQQFPGRPPAGRQLKSGRLALNISTFTHLYGYGYRNIRELNDVVTMDDPRISWVTGAVRR